MRLKTLALSVSLSLFLSSSIALARNASDIVGLFGGIMRSAMSQAAQTGNAELAKRQQENTPKRDPNDVVAQVLNYSTYGNDEGTDRAFWFKQDSGKCVYSLYSPTVAEILSGNKPEVVRTIDLDQFDPRNITFKHERVRSDTWLGRNPHVFTITAHINQVIARARGKLNLERLRHGWTLIYSKYCTGKRKEF
jgi:hypothetical protein